MKTIQLTQGQVALVDDDDFERVNKFKWYFDGRYAKRIKRVKDGRRKTIYLHKIILMVPSGFYVDHINRDKLNCQKENLRVGTHSQNKINVVRPNITGFRGVSIHGPTGLYRAKCGKKSFGYYKTALEAAVVYDREIKKVQGEFAILNFSTH